MDDLDKKSQKLFDTVYQWGRIGVITDHKSPYFIKLLEETFVQALQRKLNDGTN